MITSFEDLKQVLEMPQETEVIEFKEARTDFDKTKLLNYCIAIANERGGSLVLGVSDKLPRQIVGTVAHPNVSKIREKIHIVLKMVVDIVELDCDGKRVLIFNIPSRPIGTPLEYQGRYLMRVGEQLVSMTPDRLKDIIDEGKESFLDQIAVNGLSGSEVLELLDTQSYFDLLDKKYPSERIHDLDYFEKDGLLIKEGSTYSITNLGALLFAKDLNQFGDLIFKAPRVIFYDGPGKLKTLSDLRGQMGYASGFSSLFKYVVDKLPSNEVLKGHLRETVLMYPEIAIRELMANALIHQDFNVNGRSLRIEVYSDRIEISNPGEPTISTDRFIDNDQARNIKLANLMRRFRICEQKGSGIDNVVFNAELYQLPAPEFRVKDGCTQAVLFAHKDFLEMDREEKIRAVYQHCCLLYVMNKKMTNETVRERFKLTPKQTSLVSRLIQDVTKEGRIRLEDTTKESKRYAKYVPFWA